MTGQKEPTQVEGGTEGRRSFLGKVAAGGAIAWMAPTIAAVPAFAQASPPPCVPGSLSWNAEYPGNKIVDANYDPIAPANGGFLAELAVTGNSLEYVNTGIMNTFRRPAPGTQRSLRIQMNGGAAADGGPGPVVLTITFDQPVYQPSFSILDLDKSLATSPTDWIDLVSVTAFDGAVPAAEVDLAHNAPGQVDFTGTTTTNVIAAGTENVPNNSADQNGDPGAVMGDADVLITASGFVKKIVISYERGGANQSQGIGVSDIHWDCP